MVVGPRTPRLVAVLAAALLLATVGPTHAAGPLAPTLAAGGQVDPDSVLMSASLQPDGDATWAVTYRVRLDDENATAAFDSLAADVRANASGYEARFADRMNRTVAVAENATGRSMTLRNVTVQTARQDLGQRYGVLTYRFEWTNFAVANRTTIVAGDAVAGLFLDAETAFSMRWPPGYERVVTDPPPDESGDRSVTWRGPQEFAPDRPRLVVSTSAAGASEGLPLPLIAGGLLVLAAMGGFLYWRHRHDGRPADSAGEEPPSDLLSNEERVLRLLQEHGGRMKQQQVVEELGWTDAKTSQVVGDLRESGEIEGFRLGRENVLRLPDEEE